MNQPAPPKSSNPLLFIVGMAAVLLLIALSFVFFPFAPTPAPSREPAGTDDEVVFVLETAPPAAPSAPSAPDAPVTKP